MKLKILLFSVLTCTLVLPGVNQAQHKIQSSVFGNGGAATASNANRIVGTLGQALTGVSSNPANIAHSGFWPQTVDLVTSVEQIPAETIPEQFRLYQNYPNPFNPTTTLRFDLPKTSSVRLKLYDILGREVVILIDEKLEPGEYKVEVDATGFSPGVVFLPA